MLEIYNLPESSSDLVDHLDDKFPDRCIQPDMTLTQAHFEAGQRSVVDYLIALRSEERE